MIRAEMTIKVTCDTLAEVDAAKKKLADAGYTVIVDALTPKTFTAKLTQQLDQV